MEIKEYLNWEDVNMTWEDVNMTWEEVFILIEVGGVIKKGGGYAEYVKGNPWEKTKGELGEEKTKKFIKLFCRVNNLDYEKTIEPNNDVKISVSQLERVFNEGSKIGIKIDFQK